MPSGLPLLVFDAAELGSDVARGGSPQSTKELADQLERRHKLLLAKQIRTEMQIAEIEKFHKELTGNHSKEASLGALNWVAL
jgi:hypothetical protein